MSGDTIDWADQDWNDLVPRLLLLANLRVARSGLYGPDSPNPQDFVDAAVARTLSGRRAWDPNASALYEHLAAIVGDEISAAARSGGSGLTAAPLSSADESQDPGQSDDWRDRRRDLLDHLYDENAKLGEMASLMLVENCHDSAELASALETVPPEIAKLRRRMKQEVRAYIAEGRG